MKNHIYLVQIFGAGNPKINKYISFYGNAEKCVNAVMKKDPMIIKDIRLQNLQKASMKRCDDIIDYCKKNGIRIMTVEDSDYPETLKNIYDYPIVLFCDGDIACLNKKLPISIVGPRKPDSYTSNQANLICGNLVKCGFMLVSGLAFGVDSVAHNACISNKTPTAAILACGIDIEYPFGSMKTRELIKKYGGVIITEMLPGVKCTPGYFHIRNRIISGISYGTVVIGGSNKSGSMLTAHHAFEQDRDLFFTLPRDTFDPAYSNVIKYLRDGAVPAYDHNDIINEYTSRYPRFFEASGVIEFDEDGPDALDDNEGAVINNTVMRDNNITECSESSNDQYASVDSVTDSKTNIDIDTVDQNIEQEFKDDTDIINEFESTDNTIIADCKKCDQNPERDDLKSITDISNADPVAERIGPEDGSEEDDNDSTSFMKRITEERMIDIFNKTKAPQRPKLFMKRFGMIEAERELKHLIYLEEKKKKTRQKMTTEERAAKKAKREFIHERIRILSSMQERYIKKQLDMHEGEDPTRHKMRAEICRTLDEEENENTVYYKDVTPKNFMKKTYKKRISKKTVFEEKAPLSVNDEHIEIPAAKPVYYVSGSDPSSKYNLVYKFILSREKATFEEIMKGVNVEFSELTELLTDLELDGKVIPLAGSLYSANRSI